MRGTYRCTNVKFCMEDENQRRAWEYLHGLNRRDGSYGKVLVAGVVLEGITDYFAEKAVFQGAEQGTDGAQVSKQQEQEEEIAEDMLDFAFSMGE